MALHESDALATNWNPNADDSVSRIVVSDPNVYVGAFFNVGGQARSHVAALNINTDLASSWDPDASRGQVRTITLGANTVYLGAGFCRYRTQRSRLYRAASEFRVSA